MPSLPATNPGFHQQDQVVSAPTPHQQLGMLFPGDTEGWVPFLSPQAHPTGMPGQQPSLSTPSSYSLGQDDIVQDASGDSEGSEGSEDSEELQRDMRNLRHRRRRREVTLFKKVHELHTENKCEVYLVINHHETDHYLIYNSSPTEDFPKPYEKLKAWYPRPEINTPKHPNTMLKKAKASRSSTRQPYVTREHVVGGVTASFGHKRAVPVDFDIPIPSKRVASDFTQSTFAPAEADPQTPPKSLGSPSPPGAPRPHERQAGQGAHLAPRVLATPSKVGKVSRRFGRGRRARGGSGQVASMT